jgi:hypothetical protein
MITAIYFHYDPNAVGVLHGQSMNSRADTYRSKILEGKVDLWGLVRGLQHDFN